LQLTLALKLLIGDVLSGTTSAGVHHRGILEGWFGPHLWNSRAIVLLVTVLLVFAPLVSLKRLATFSCWHVGKIDYPSPYFLLLATWIYCNSCHFLADALKYTSALSVALAVIFVVITAGIAIIKLCSGTVAMPKLFPELDDLSSIWNLFTAVPVLVTAYICHYNGMQSHCTDTLPYVQFWILNELCSLFHSPQH
jgi:solute carrier family 38 (sodium-coupled neutral amino acid transporter), member 2